MTNIARKITLGFRLMSGYHQRSISKDEVEKLGHRNDIPWNSIQLSEELNLVGRQLLRNPIIKRWSQWGLSMRKVLSDAVALNFLLVLSKDWVTKDKPANSRSGDYKKFQKNARIMLDRSIFEYSTGRWRGSSDSRIAANLASMEGGPDVLRPVDNNAWVSLTDELLEEGRIEGRSCLAEPLEPIPRIVRPILYYYYLLKGIDPPPTIERPVEIDHIIPKTFFDLETDKIIRRQSHHITNLELLPKTPNAVKSNTRLDLLSDEVVKREVAKYSEIPESDFDKYNSVADFGELHRFRGALIREVLTDRRAQVVGG